jgi:predicted membrane chloride channel (bestrophin family)
MSHMMVMETAICAMVAGASAAERIVNTPSPFNIVVHMR